MTYATSATTKQQAISAAEGLYNYIASPNWLGKIKSLFSGHNNHLLTLPDLETTIVLKGHRNLGQQQVSIEAIKGSATAGRQADFDADFRPLQRHNKNRWISVATAHKLAKSLPPVSLIKVGDAFYIQDGHHRVSVAKAMGFDEIEATVTVWQVDELKPSVG